MVNDDKILTFEYQKNKSIIDDINEGINDANERINYYNECLKTETDSNEILIIQQGLEAEEEMLRIYNKRLVEAENPNSFIDEDFEKKWIEVIQPKLKLERERSKQEKELEVKDTEVDKLFEDNHFWSGKDLLKSNLKGQHWFVNDIIAEHNFTMFYGRASAYKTWLAINLAISLSCGKPWLKDVMTEKVKVLYLDNESNDVEAKRRLTMVLNGMNLSDKEKDDVNDNFYYFNPNEPLNNYMLRRAIKRKVKECGIKVIFVDSFIEFTSHNENDSRENSIFFAALKKMQKELDVTFVFIHHQGKATDSNKHILDVARGSSQIIGCMRNAFEFKTGRDNTVVINHSKSNLCKKREDVGVRVNFDEEYEDNKVTFDKVEVVDVKLVKPIAEDLADKIIAWTNIKSITEFKTKDVRINFATYKGSQITNALNMLVADDTLKNPSKGKYCVNND